MVYASPKSAEFKGSSGLFHSIITEVRNSCFHGLSLPDDEPFSAQSPVPEGAIPPAGKRSLLLLPAFWAIGISYHPEVSWSPG